MGKAPLNVQIDFNLTDPGGAFSYKGNLGKFDLRELDEMSKALGMVTIQSGIIRKADFSVEASSRGSNGNINLYYNDLRIALVEKDENSRALEKKGLLSFLANTVLIKNNNPSGDEALRRGPITFERPNSSSFFNLMWKSIFNGFKEAAGLGILSSLPPPETSQKQKKQTLADERKERREERSNNKQDKQGQR